MKRRISVEAVLCLVDDGGGSNLPINLVSLEELVKGRQFTQSPRLEWLASAISDECAKPLTQLARLGGYGVKRTRPYALVTPRQHARRSRMRLFEPRDQVGAAR